MEAKTDTESLASRIALHPFLAGLSEAHLATLMDCAKSVHFEPGQTILREREFANRLYLIESGKVILESSAEFGDPVVIETLEAGHVLGWSWMFPPYAWHFTARAREEVEAISFDATKLRELCERDHSLGYALLKRIASIMVYRLQAGRRKMLAIHSRCERLPPVIGLSPFMEQEMDTGLDDDEFSAEKETDQAKWD